MNVYELMAFLASMPEDAEVEVNDNNNGLIHCIHSVDHFGNTDYDEECVIIQVNCD